MSGGVSVDGQPRMARYRWSAPNGALSLVTPDSD